MSEGAEVRKAFDGPKPVEHDALIDFYQERIDEEYKRSADASESGSKTDAFIKKTELNSQALAWGKVILKKEKKKDGQIKAMDVITSLEMILPILKSHVGGQGTVAMNFDNDPKPPVEAGMNNPETQPEPDEDPDEELATFADEEVDEETAEFNSEVDEVMDEAAPEPEQSDPFENDAHGRGMHDYSEGVARDDNPFDETLMKHEIWNSGWDEAAELDNTETGRGMENVVKPAFGGAE